MPEGPLNADTHLSADFLQWQSGVRVAVFSYRRMSGVSAVKTQSSPLLIFAKMGAALFFAKMITTSVGLTPHPDLLEVSLSLKNWIKPRVHGGRYV